MPQDSILEPILFNIFLNNLFLFISNSSLSNYAMTIHSTLLEIIWKWSRVIYETVLIRCINGFTKIIWCLMQENVILCVSGITRKTKHSYSIAALTENSNEQKIRGVIIENKLNFKSHLSELRKEACQNIAALSRLSSYLHNAEKKLIFNSIIISQFSYCPLARVFCLRTSNNMIKKLHERSLRIILNYTQAILT